MESPTEGSEGKHLRETLCFSGPGRPIWRRSGETLRPGVEAIWSASYHPWSSEGTSYLYRHRI